MRPLFSLLLRCTCSLGTPGFVRLSQPLVSCFWLRHLTRPETYEKLILVLFDASLRASSKQTFSFTIHFLFYIHLFHVSSTYCFLYLARRGFRLLPSFRWDTLWGIFSDVTLPYTHTSWDISTALFSFSLMLSLRASSKQTFSFSVHFSLLHTSVSSISFV